MGSTSKWHFVSGFPSGRLEIPKLGLLWLWGPITLCADLRLRWGLKQRCSPRWELSNDMQRNWGDSQLLVVGSQIANLTHGPSFNHNLCFMCPNGSCEPILDVDVPRAFQWYKELFNPMIFDPYNRLLKIQESIGTRTPQNGSSFGSVKVHSLTLFCTPESMKCDSWA
jgi:hypothetical protein